MALAEIRDTRIDAAHQIPDKLDGTRMRSGARL
jgi:hypothetical protein